MKIIIKKGRELSNKFIEEWNKIMYDAFKEDEPLKPKARKKFENDVFFILINSKKEILSTARLRPVEVKFMDKKYKILGIADMVSPVKKKGYGKKIVKAMIKYAKSKNIEAVGFCHKKNKEFYEKCGLEMDMNSKRQFVFRNKKGKKCRNEYDDYAIYLKIKGGLMEEVLKNPKEEVLIPIKHW